jgi:alkylation response protein AidB-like acyl-CoA dehydrogenase
MMNYDFSEKEFSFFIELHQLLAKYAEGKKLDDCDLAGSENNLRQAMAMLAGTPYLKLAIEPVDGFNGLLTLTGAWEVLASISPSLYISVETSARIFGRIISAWGDDVQKKKWLPEILSGKVIGAVGLSEESLNIDNAPLATLGVLNGDKVEISGRKQYVVNGPMADWFAVVGNMGDKPAIFMVEKGNPGLIIGARSATIGYGGAAISPLELKNCVIPAANVLFPADAKSMTATLRLWENQILMGASLGLMKAAFESARTYAKTHKTGGKPIIAFQEIGFKLSEMLTLFQTSQLFAYRTAWTSEKDPKEAESLTLCAKVFCTESAEQVACEAMKILGGAGYLSGNAVEQAFRCAKYGQIAGTSTEIARVKIGDTALGLRN